MDNRSLAPVTSSPQSPAAEDALGAPPNPGVAARELVASDVLAALFADPRFARLFGFGGC